MTCLAGLQTGDCFSEKSKDQELSGHRVSSGEPGASRISPLGNVESRQGPSDTPRGLSGWVEPVRRGEVSHGAPLVSSGGTCLMVWGQNADSAGVGAASALGSVCSVLGGNGTAGRSGRASNFRFLPVLQMPL